MNTHKLFFTALDSPLSFGGGGTPAGDVATSAIAAGGLGLAVGSPIGAAVGAANGTAAGAALGAVAGGASGALIAQV